MYYKYVHIENPLKVRDEQRELCQRLGIKGRIIVADEGINGTLEGTVESTEKYIEEMEKSEYFKGIVYKKSVGIGDAFPRLSVKYRPEVVSAHMPELNPNKVTGKYLSADELHQWYEEGREFYVVDMRNDYEYLSGYFENFIPADLKNFYDLPKVLPKLEHLKIKLSLLSVQGEFAAKKHQDF